MPRYVATAMTSILLITQLSIFYFWIVDWQKVVTQAGLFIWGGSILLGFVLYGIYRKLDKKTFSVNRKVVLIGTSVTIFLAILSLLIEAVTRSMP